MQVIDPQQFFGYRDAVDYLNEVHGLETYYEKFIYDVQQERIVPLMLGERFPVLSRKQLDEYAKKGETKITVPEGVLVGTDAAAALAGQTVANFKKMVYGGKVPVHRIGGKLAFNVSDISALQRLKARSDKSE